ncbi:MAG: LacI family DNA-binding transcriptional regulator [Verrucomicrobia bacterium]|nr:LacI family DNA-binding transcriptional regulator [Verrucomicrobiota bacterium]
MSNRITMQDVAKRVGCSKNAVSLALRNSPQIGAATRKRIQELAKKMGYRPNPMVSALMAQNASRVSKSSAGTVIGFLTHWPEMKNNGRQHPNTIQFFAGMQRRAEELGYRVEEFSTWAGHFTPKRLHQVLMTRGIHGLVLATQECHEEFQKLPREHYIAAGSCPELTECGVSCAITDCFGNLVMAMKKLEFLGYRRPGLVISHFLDHHTNFQYRGGYDASAGTSSRMTGLPIHYVSRPDPRTSLRQWVEANRPDVVLGHFTTLQMLREIGFSIPGDLGFAILDRHHAHKGIAGFDSRLDLLGEACIDLITSRLNRNEFGPPKNARTIVVHGEWIDGASLPARLPGTPTGV